MVSIYSKIVKEKKLQVLGHGCFVLIPKNWIETLNWSKQTNLLLEIRPVKREVVISEKTSELISV